MNDRRGFALIATLWLLVAFSAIGLELELRVRARRLAVANRVESSRAFAGALAGIEEARARLSLSASRFGRDGTGGEVLVDPWHRPETLFADSIRLNAGYVRVRLTDGGSALHLNHASEEELRRLFVSLRIDAGKADRLAQAIADWRDPDDLHRARGAEAREYARRRLPSRPANRPFSRLAELRQVLGMDHVLYERVRPYLTLAGSGVINLNAAPRPVLLALKGMTEEAADLILDRLRTSHPIRSFNEVLIGLSAGARSLLQASLPQLVNRVRFETTEVLALSESRLEGSPVVSRIEVLFVRAGDEAVAARWVERP